MTFEQEVQKCGDWLMQTEFGPFDDEALRAMLTHGRTFSEEVLEVRAMNRAIERELQRRTELREGAE